MSGLARFLIAFTLLFLLAACGGGDADAPWDGTTSTGSGQTIDDVGTGQAVILLGSGSGASFNAGVLSIAVTSLSAGGQTTITATLADASGNLYQDSSSVSFASDCVASGLASMETPIDATGGVATTTYLATGCSGADAIRATATVNGNTTTATGTINVQPAEIGSMEFISAEPSLIGLRGVGLTEVSRVTFMVLDKNGNPVTQQLVSFSLSTNVGGVSIPAGAETATSDINGLVGTDVKSGTVSTTMRVTATLASNPLISSQSDGLVISTGVSDQDSMSLSAEVFNPEAWRYDGVKVGITIHAADHFNNPVPDGTAIYFTTEGGQIQSQCQIVDGACSVDWTSSNPRPPEDGRVTILAAMLGEESFLDANGNGVLDLGDTASSRIPEAFRDDNEDGIHNLGLEEFIDFNSNSLYDGADRDSNYNGVLCCDSLAVAVAQEAVAEGEDPGICFDVA
ncbi:MAG: Ig-like domain-containing protein, partial [Candidatus Thiodiazotropha sp. (ex Lucinoma kastoroae)]|nr:Ig-like domain-containing protein [Candidatus Thiodiazotropha sp. (ex Lucinoma kastoroae)]